MHREALKIYNSLTKIADLACIEEEKKLERHDKTKKIMLPSKDI